MEYYEVSDLYIYIFCYARVSIYTARPRSPAMKMMSAMASYPDSLPELQTGRGRD